MKPPIPAEVSLAFSHKSVVQKKQRAAILGMWYTINMFEVMFSWTARFRFNNKREATVHPVLMEKAFILKLQHDGVE